MLHKAGFNNRQDRMSEGYVSHITGSNYGSLPGRPGINQAAYADNPFSEEIRTHVGIIITTCRTFH